MFGRAKAWWHRREGGNTALAVEDRRARERRQVDLELLAYRLIDPSRPPMRARRAETYRRSAFALRSIRSSLRGRPYDSPVSDAEGRPDLSVLACVVRVDNRGEGYTLGCTFTEEIDGPTMDQLGAKRAENRLQDCQRVWERVEVSGNVIFERAMKPGKSLPRRTH